jgi:intein/homing endonuclease
MASIELFGWEFKRKDDKEKQLGSFTPQESNDGAVLIAAGSGYGTYVDLDGTVRTEAELVTKYREMSLQPECDAAVDEIVNESISIDEDIIVSINLEDVKGISEKLKNLIKDEFHYCLKLLDFQTHAYDIYRRWYIDGRLYFHVMIDKEKPKDGIKELRYVDPRKIRKVREIQKKRTGLSAPGDSVVTQTINEYYIFNDKGFNYGNKVVGPSTTGLKIAKDAILHVTSGLTDNQGTMVLSYLHKAIKALNQLRVLEDALVIYRLCLIGDTRIKTSTGWKYIKDVQEGEKVFSLNEETMKIVSTRVKKQWCTGQKEVFSVSSKHHEIIGTDNHPIFVKNKKTGEMGYVDIKDIIPTVHQFVYVKPEEIFKEKEFPKIREYIYRLKEPLTEPVIGMTALADSLGLSRHRISKFCFQGRPLKEEEVYRVLERIPSAKEPELIREYASSKDENGHGGNCLNQVNVPQYIDEEFSKLFGFLIGDGWISNSKIIFAEGIEPAQNLFYQNLMIKYFDNSKHTKNSSNKSIYGEYITNNKLGAELLNKLGFITGSHNKRIPSWVFEAKESIKRAFIEGLADADGTSIPSPNNIWMTRIKLCNKQLIEDIKELWSSMGLSSGKIRHEIVPAGKIHDRQVQNDFEAWAVQLSNIPLPSFETIGSVKQHADEKCSVYELEIDSEQFHNFVVGQCTIAHNSRAPERRIWYIDVGNLPKIKAEQYLRDIQVRHRNRLVYDAQDGSIKDDRKFMTMLEDYWLPRREGGKGTEVITLPGGQTLGQMDDVLYFQKKFLNALNVPISRLNSDSMFSVGRATEITRDELKFQRFVIRLRMKFTILFADLLRKQLALKGIMSLEDYDAIVHDIRFDYARDNYFTELKRAEIEQNRINLAMAFQPVIGKYFSHNWLRKEILQQTDDEIKEEDEEIHEEIESNDPRWINPLVLQNEQLGDQLYQEKMGNMQQDSQQEEMMQGQQGGMSPPGQEGMQGAMGQGMQEDSEAQKDQELRDALILVKHMKDKGKPNRTMQDEARYKHAVQLIAQNKDRIKERAIPTT